MKFIHDTPFTPAYVRNEFLYNQQSGFGEFTECTVFGFRAESARAPMFQVMLANGAQWARVPIHALCDKPCEALGLSLCAWWDSFGYTANVHAFEFLKNHRVQALGRDKTIRHGRYLFTIDWAKDNWSETPDQHKNHHVIVLDDGPWIAYPNNRLIWTDPSWIEPDVDRGWQSPSHNYSVEASC
jgi:hypothetical protein